MIKKQCRYIDPPEQIRPVNFLDELIRLMERYDDSHSPFFDICIKCDTDFVSSSPSFIKLPIRTEHKPTLVESLKAYQGLVDGNVDAVVNSLFKTGYRIKENKSNKFYNDLSMMVRTLAHSSTLPDLIFPIETEVIYREYYPNIQLNTSTEMLRLLRETSVYLYHMLNGSLDPVVICRGWNDQKKRLEAFRWLNELRSCLRSVDNIFKAREGLREIVDMIPLPKKDQVESILFDNADTFV